MSLTFYSSGNTVNEDSSKVIYKQTVTSSTNNSEQQVDSKT